MHNETSKNVCSKYIWSNSYTADKLAYIECCIQTCYNKAYFLQYLVMTDSVLAQTIPSLIAKKESIRLPK